MPLPITSAGIEAPDFGWDGGLFALYGLTRRADTAGEDRIRELLDLLDSEADRRAREGEVDAGGPSAGVAGRDTAYGGGWG